MYNAAAIITKSGVFDTIVSGEIVSGNNAGFSTLKRVNKEVWTEDYFRNGVTGAIDNNKVYLSLDRGLSNIRNYNLHSGYTGLLGVVSANSEHSSVYAAYNAFDDSPVKPWLSDIIYNSYIQYKFNNPEFINEYAIQTLDSTLTPFYGKLKEWSLSGSKDGVDWRLLDYRNSLAPDNIYTKYSISGDKQDLYSYYRLFVYTAVNDSFAPFDATPALLDLDFLNSGEKIPLWSEVQIKTPTSGTSLYSGKNDEALLLKNITGGNGVQTFESGGLVYLQVTGIGNTGILSSGALFTVSGSQQLQGVYDISGINGIDVRLQGNSILIDGANVSGNGGGGAGNTSLEGYYLRQSKTIRSTGIRSAITSDVFKGANGISGNFDKNLLSGSLVKFQSDLFLGCSSATNCTSTFFNNSQNLASGTNLIGNSGFVAARVRDTLDIYPLSATLITGGVSGSGVFVVNFANTFANTLYLNALGASPTASLTVSSFIIEEWASGVPIYGYANKAWLTYSGANGGTSPNLYSSGNISSVVRNGSGDYTIYFQTGFADAYYLASYAGRGTSTTPVIITEQNDSPFRTTTGVRIYNLNQSFSGKDDAFVTCEWKSY